MEIIKPNEKYLQSYLEGCQQTWETVHEKYIIHDPEKFDDWKTHIFQDFENAEKGINLPERFIPNATYWIVEDEKYAGTINIRLGLNEALARYGGHIGIVIRPDCRRKGYGMKGFEFAVEECKKLGINPILVATQETNKVIINWFENIYKPNKSEREEIIHNGAPLGIRRYYFSY